MSQFTEELKAFAIRLERDGYPTALIERAAARMEAMEAELVRIHKTLNTPMYDFEELTPHVGPCVGEES